MVSIKEELQPLSAMKLLPIIGVLHRAAVDAGKPSSESHAYNDFIGVGFTSKHERIAGNTFFEGKYKPSFIDDFLHSL